MKLKIDCIPVMTIEEFADKNELVMEICERRVPEGDANRFYASFESCEVKGNGVLIGVHGDGSTHEEAIRDYACRISLTTIVMNAYAKDRKEIQVPRLK